MSPEALAIDIKNLAGSSIASVEISKTATVKDLKQKLEEVLRWTSELQKLLLDSGADLSPDGKTLIDFAGEREQLDVLLIKIFVEEVYFLGACFTGISSKACTQIGDNLTSRNDHDHFKKIPRGQGLFAFESVTHPGLFMGVGYDKLIVLCKPDDNKEVFRQCNAVNGEKAKVSMESVAYPGHFLAQSHGKLYVRTNDPGLFKGFVTWQIVEPSTGINAKGIM